ncbi:hypothetical protein ACIBIZ_50875 [Nonomuraea spiralis]|nr:hypothetical protein [Nonomuraea sp. WAC 01424]
MQAQWATGYVIQPLTVTATGTLAPAATGLRATRPDGDTALPSGYTCA